MKKNPWNRICTRQWRWGKKLNMQPNADHDNVCKKYNKNNFPQPNADIDCVSLGYTTDELGCETGNPDVATDCIGIPTTHFLDSIFRISITGSLCGSPNSETVAFI